MSKTSDDVRTVILAQASVEPGAGVGPLAFRGPQGKAQRSGGVLQREASEKSQVHQTCGGGVFGRELRQSVIEGNQLLVVRLEGDLELVEIDATAIASAFDALLIASPIEKNSPHRLGGRGEEVSPAVPAVGRFAPDQPDVSFVDESGGLEGLAGLLAGESLRRQFPQFIVDEREEFLGGLGVTPLDGGQDVGNLAHGLEHTRQGLR